MRQKFGDENSRVHIFIQLYNIHKIIQSLRRNVRLPYLGRKKNQKAFRASQNTYMALSDNIADSSDTVANSSDNIGRVTLGISYILKC